ncbi:LysR substrate-binding domain-containing protein [Acidisphaera sp. L21]|uniref:LysR substrate-binding domain-containing protein n=1 Tax=Acidisphaera sp. L21 TaxID=1641851 RepID=UPI0020B16E3D|nr:LysR substrate-binding domain-containing protein [Acidisphaera sp. L21]
MFLEVAETLSMGRAAETLHTVQSAVTTRIRKLEDELGHTLFQRHARGVVLTPAGERLLPYARQVTTLLVEARQAVTDEADPQGSMVLGSLETTAALRLGPMMARFSMAYPKVDLTLRTGTTAELLAQVLRQELEGAFVCGPVAHPHLIADPVLTEELVLVAAPGTTGLDFLTNARQVRILVLRRGCSYRQRLEELLTRRGAAVVRVLEYGTFDAILACVSAAMGVTLLPRALLERCVPKYDVACIPLPGHEGRADTVFVRRTQSYVSTALSAFLQTVKADTHQDVARAAE